MRRFVAELENKNVRTRAQRNTGQDRANRDAYVPLARDVQVHDLTLVVLHGDGVRGY